MNTFIDYLPHILYGISFACGALAVWLIKKDYQEVDHFWREYDD